MNDNKTKQLIQIFESVTDEQLKHDYDGILYKVIVALDVMFTPNLSPHKQQIEKTPYDLYKRDRGVLYNDIVEISFNNIYPTLISNIEGKTSIPFDTLFSSLLDLRSSLKNEIAYVKLNKYVDVFYADVFDRLNTIQSNIKKFVNYFWGNIGKSILIESEVDIKTYVHNSLTKTHSLIESLYKDNLVASDLDTFYIRKGAYTFNYISTSMLQFGFSLYTRELKSFAVTPSGDFIKFDYYIDSYECNGTTIKAKNS